jgi:hypothetical protein
MHDYEKVMLGEYCEDLLNQENFVTLVKLCEQQIAQHFLTTKPEEKAKREGIYATYQGLAEFLGLMTAFVEAKNAINKVNQTELPEDMGALSQEID